MKEVNFIVNYWETDNNAQGGRLWVSETEIYFKPFLINFGNLAKKVIKIIDIYSIEKVNDDLFGLSREIHVVDKNGNTMRFVSWNRAAIIAEINEKYYNITGTCLMID